MVCGHRHILVSRSSVRLCNLQHFMHNKKNLCHGSTGKSEIQEHCSLCTKKQKQSKQMLTMHSLIVITRQKKCRDIINS
jgi:hypothetical protein